MCVPGEGCSLLCVCCVQLRQWLQEVCTLIQAEESVQSNIRTQLTEMRVSRATCIYTAHDNEDKSVCASTPSISFLSYTHLRCSLHHRRYRARHCPVLRTRLHPLRQSQYSDLMGGAQICLRPPNDHDRTNPSPCP